MIFKNATIKNNKKDSNNTAKCANSNIKNCVKQKRKGDSGKDSGVLSQLSNNQRIDDIQSKKTKQKEYKYFWTKNGRVCIKKNEGISAIYVANEDIVNLLVEVLLELVEPEAVIITKIWLNDQLECSNILVGINKDVMLQF